MDPNDVVGLDIGEHDQQPVLIRGGPDQLVRGADGESVPVAAVGYIIENISVVMRPAVFPENTENRIARHGAEGHHPAGDGTLCQALGDDKPLGGNDFLPVFLGGGRIQQNINTEVARVTVLILPEDVFVTQRCRSPDGAAVQYPGVCLHGRGLQVHQNGVADTAGEPGNRNPVADDMVLIIFPVALRLGCLTLTGKHRERRIDDFTFINFADLILGNPERAAFNIDRIRNSLTIPKDGQAVFANLEKVYLYRYVFTKAVASEDAFIGVNTEAIPDREVRHLTEMILRDREDDRYRGNTLFQDLLLWIGREYQKHGITYVEITDTALLNRGEAPARLRQIHEILPSVTRETGVMIRFLAGIRRIPLTIVRDKITPGDYIADNLQCLRAIAGDPYIAGSDIIGEEINDILELRGVLRELVAIAGENPGFVIRIHAGENDSLPDNVANSIRCIEEALRPDQAFPPVRIGHGLYTCDLNSSKGKKLLEEMRKNNVTLEFQITSNVRLNNLSALDRHPLRQYLQAGINCVQGTDGGALYGTNSIDEELSLEKLLGLTHAELCQMKEADSRIAAESMRIFREKEQVFRSRFSGGDLENYYSARLREETGRPENLWQDSGKSDSLEGLRDQISPLPERIYPIIIAGGSFNNSQHRTIVRPEDRTLIDALLRCADPEKTVFVVGHSLNGQEGYLARKAAGKFRVFAIVPNRITRAEKKKLLDAKVNVLISIESSGMGLYKSFAYEIFKRMPSALLAFDGNSAALNLIQEAKNGREKCRIYINSKSRGLQAKAKMLEGYVMPLEQAKELFDVQGSGVRAE